MVEPGPYEIMPYHEVENIKKELEIVKNSKTGSEELKNSINKVTNILESMLLLFEQAAHSMKKESTSPVTKKVDKVLEQHEIIAESILTLVDLIKNIKKNQEKTIRKVESCIDKIDDISESSTTTESFSRTTMAPPPISEPKQPIAAPPPLFEKPPSQPTMKPRPSPIPPPDFSMQTPEPPPMPHSPRGMPPPTREPPRAGPTGGPQIMPTGSFNDLEPPKKDKKGLFGISLKK